MGPDPPYGAIPGQFPAQDCAMDQRDEDEEVGGWGVVVSSAGDIDGGGGF